MNTIHPANLALRFVLEISALCGIGALVWASTNGVWRYLFMVLAIGFLMLIWGGFAVPNDPSRSGGAPIPVSGLIRLALEIAILLGGALSFYLAGFRLAGASLALLIALHYALSGPRVTWLLQQ